MNDLLALAIENSGPKFGVLQLGYELARLAKLDPPISPQLVRALLVGRSDVQALGNGLYQRVGDLPQTTPPEQPKVATENPPPGKEESLVPAPGSLLTHATQFAVRGDVFDTFCYAKNTRFALFLAKLIDTFLCYRIPSAYIDPTASSYLDCYVIFSKLSDEQVEQFQTGKLSLGAALRQKPSTVISLIEWEKSQIRIKKSWLLPWSLIPTELHPSNTRFLTREGGRYKLVDRE